MVNVKDENHEDDVHLNNWKQNVVDILNQAVPTHFFKLLSKKQEEDIFSLDRATVEKIISRMQYKNQYVAPYNPTHVLPHGGIASSPYHSRYHYHHQQ